MPATVVFTKDAPPAIGPYSQGMVVSGKLLFTAGQIAIDPRSGQVVPGDIKAQTRQVLANIKAILEQAGCSLESVVKTTVFLSDMGEFGAMNDVYAESFRQHPPARSTVEVARLPKDVKIEIEVVAVVER